MTKDDRVETARSALEQMDREHSHHTLLSCAGCPLPEPALTALESLSTELQELREALIEARDDFNRVNQHVEWLEARNVALRGRLTS